MCRCLSEHIYDDVVQLAHVSPTRQCALLQPSFRTTLHTASWFPRRRRRQGTEEAAAASAAVRVVLARAGSQLAGSRAGRVTSGVSSSLLADGVPLLLLFLAGRPLEPLCWPWRSWRPPRSCVTVAVQQQSVRLDPIFFFHFFTSCLWVKRPFRLRGWAVPVPGSDSSSKANHSGRLKIEGEDGDSISGKLEL